MSVQKAQRIVFAVTSGGRDLYSAMTRVAIASLRLTNPALLIVVACDRQTDQALAGSRDPLVNEVDEWLAIDTPPGDAGFRNRFVKTSLGEVIAGPFLFLDSDVCVRGSLSEIFMFDTDIAGARNHSQDDFALQIWDMDVAVLASMGWSVGDSVYVNGGVLYCSGTPKAKAVWSEWHQRWLRTWRERNSYRDQPALNSAIYQVQPRLTVLPHRYNAQFKRNPAVASGAVLWHYYFSVGEIPDTPYERLVNAVAQGAQMRSTDVATIQQYVHPWRRATIIDDLAAARIVRKGSFDGWAAAWLRREVMGYLAERAKRTLMRLCSKIGVPKAK